MKTLKAGHKYMRLAIAEARKNLADSKGGPFGACLVKGKRVLAVSRNTVLVSRDATCHAEINAIRKASRMLKSHCLSGCVIYSTTEPCPMCFAAIHWAGIAAVYFGTAIEEVRKLGFNELRISCRKMRSAGKSRVRIFSGFSARECRDLLADWKRSGEKKVY